jgi:NAD-dependent DNA ligase
MEKHHPANLVYHEQHKKICNINELKGLCKGIIADGQVVQAEAEFLKQWLESHQALIDQWPINALYQRITDMLVDGVLDEEEQVELLEALKTLSERNQKKEVVKTDLPVTKPVPQILFEERNFYLVGRFATGSKQQCREMVELLGGTCLQEVTNSVHYLVIGELTIQDWSQSSFANEVEMALTLNQSGANIKIIEERNWIQAVDQVLLG